MLRERKKIYLACGATDMRKNSSSYFFHLKHWNAPIPSHVKFPLYLRGAFQCLRVEKVSLSTIVSESIKLNPFDDALFVFCNGQKDILKILEWDGDGFWLHTKRLEKGRFQWPARVDDEKKMDLTYKELEILIGGTLLVSKFKRREILNLGA